MRLYERFGDGGFHTSIVTTFGVDFDTYENVVLPRLRGGGCFNNVLLADARMLTYALDGASVLPRHAGRHYTVLGAAAEGVFHPKMTLQLGRRTGRLIIGSANMTASGLAGNLELAGLVACTTDDSGERRLVAAAWQYANRLIDSEQQALAHQLAWTRARTRWLLDTEPAAGLVTLTDGTAAALLTSGGPTGIGARFAALVDERPVRRLVVLSPYWDDGLDALKHLAAQLEAEEVVILIDRDKRLFPGRALADLPYATVSDLKAFGQNRFIHAKAIIAQTAQADHVLYGSANCTVAALGTTGFAGANEEACLYRRLPPDTIVEALQLQKMLASTAPIDPADLPPCIAAETLPLEEASVRSPGRFECLFDVLVWWPPASVATEASQIELLSAGGEPVAGSLSQLAGGPGNRRRFQITGLAERPAFARVRFTDGTFSAPAVITLVDALREAVREARSNRAASAAVHLSEETEEGLWLLEVLDSLESAEAAQNDGDPGVRRTRQNAGDTTDDGEFRTLGYEQFIAGRRLRSDDLVITRNSLAGSELSLARDFLNRILSIGDTPMDGADQLDEEAMTRVLDMGDETAHAEEALESGEEFSPWSVSPDDRQADGAADRRNAAQAKATREQIVQAVDRFGERLRSKAEAGHITAFDVLRLRAILMIIAAAGQTGVAARNRRSALQVLPLDDSAYGWPKLMGRILFTLFGGPRPAIRHLQIEDMHDQIPDDILECWATCLWAAQTCVIGAALHQRLRQNVHAMLTALTRRTYDLTGLRRAELESDRIVRAFQSLNARFAKRLGVDASEIESMHAHLTKELRALASTG